MKTTRLLLLLIPFFFSSVGLHAQSNLDWWKIVGYRGVDGLFNAYQTSDCVDPNQNIIVAGTFNDSITFYDQTLFSRGMNDIFINKYGPDGTLKWTQSAGSAYLDNASSVTCDVSGNIFLTGSCELPATFGNITINGNGTVTDYCIFIAKYDTKGNALWVKTFPITGNFTESVSIKTDLSGNIYLAGTFEDSIKIETTSFYSGTQTNTNTFMAKFDSNATLKWAKQGGGAMAFANVYGMTIDNNGNSYLTGSTGPYATFDTFHVFNQNVQNSHQTFIVKYSPAGNVIRAWSSTGDGKSHANDIAVDDSGRVFITGDLEKDSIYFNKTFFNHYYIFGNSIFIASFDSAFSMKWVKEWSSPNDEEEAKLSINSKTNEVYVTGSFSDTASFDKNTLIGTGGSTFLAAITPSKGAIDWIQMTSTDLGTTSLGDIAIDNSSGQLYFTLTADWTTISLYKFGNALNIQGIVYRDKNKNGVQDFGEYGLAYSPVKITPGNLIVYTNPSGLYNAYVDSGNYSIAPILPRFCVSSSPSSHSSKINISTPADTANFGLDIPDFRDLSISVANEDVLRPGKVVSYDITVKNTGMLPIYNARVSLLPDTILSLNNTAPLYNSKSGDTLLWNIDTIKPQQALFYIAKYTIPTFAQAGTNVISSVMVIPIIRDTLPVDNFDTAKTIIVNSYDPNEKTVSPSDSNIALSTKKFTYTIHFQNTGTDTAFLIVVKDTLDANLNPETFTMISSSSPCTYTIKNSLLECRFENVNLPENKVNEEGSQGFFRYSLSPYPNLPFGTSISNTASIFFDYNTPVSTNTVVSTLNKTTGIEQYQQVNGAITVYPNPFSEYTTIVLPENIGSYSYALYNELGKQVEFKSNLNGNQFQLNKNGHTSGIYLLRVLDAEQKEIGTMKLIMK